MFDIYCDYSAESQTVHCSLKTLHVALQEMVEILQVGAPGLKGTLRRVEAPFTEWSLGDTYSLQHLAVQYNALTAALL